MIYDCFTLRDELDMLELRLSILDKVVDKFVICEANKTFTNIPKDYNYIENIERFKQWDDKIIYLPIELEDNGLDFLTKDLTYTPTSAAWQFEYQQRSALIYGLDNIKNDDLILMGDIDEIPNPQDIKNINTPTTFIMDFYYYFINNKSMGPQDKQWLGTAAVKGEHLQKLNSLQELRNIRHTLNPIKSGWHLSYMGGKEMIKEKIKTISHTEYNKKEYYSNENIELSLSTGKDIFNREGMNFQIVNLEDEYPSEILKLLHNYPNFIHNVEKIN
jgi:beta-1,4-mannosyl-glycoprotein beta-1,4-N-acetylglucosaminyltransferase